MENSGCRSMKAYWRSILRGSHSSSASKSAMNSPRATSHPVFRAFAAPWLECKVTIRSQPFPNSERRDSSVSGVSSSLASSTRISSTGLRVWHATLSTARRIVQALRKQGTTADTLAPAACISTNLAEPGGNLVRRVSTTIKIAPAKYIARCTEGGIDCAPY